MMVGNGKIFLESDIDELLEKKWYDDFPGYPCGGCAKHESDCQCYRWRVWFGKYWIEVCERIKRKEP